MLAAELARCVSDTESLQFGGFITYPAPPGAASFLSEAISLAAADGLESTVVSVGGTPGMWQSSTVAPPATEYRVGTYAFHDRATVAAGAAVLDDVALTVLATVISRPSTERAILDAGSKAISQDFGKPAIKGRPEEKVARLAEEHTKVEDGGTGPRWGERREVLPAHCCATMNLHREVLAMRDGVVEAVWAIEASGRYD